MNPRSAVVTQVELFEQVARLPVPVACLLLTGASSFIRRHGSVNHYVLTKPVDPSRLSGLLVQIAHTAEMKRFASRSMAEPRR
jgi:hypothetical protein